MLRDLNDITNAPIVLMGMEHADKKLKSYRHLYDRITAVVRFDLFTEEDIASLAGQICEVILDQSAVGFIHRASQGKLRLTTTWFSRAENLARHNELDTITGAHLQQLVRRSK